MNVLKVAHFTDVSFSALKELNSTMDVGVMKIAYHGEIVNGFDISKEVFEDAIKGLPYTPVVCLYNKEADDFEGHEFDVVEGQDGKAKFIAKTTPVGVVPDSGRIWWETDEDDGREYLCSDVIIWKRQEPYDKLKSNGFTKQSMEIQLVDYESVGDVDVVKKFEFVALCLLGDDHEPAFEHAGLSMFTKIDQEAYKQMVAELKQLKSFAQEDDNQGEEVTEPIMLISRKIELLEKAVVEYGENTDDNYWFIDCDDTNVYYLSYNERQIFASAYSIGDDDVSVKFDEKQPKKISYVDIVEGEAEESGLFALADEVVNAKSLIEENESLRKYQKEKEQAERETAIAGVFTDFSMLDGVEEFEQLKANYSEMSVDDVVNQCHIINSKVVLGKKKNPEVFEQKSQKLPVEKVDRIVEKPYGGLFDEFPPTI